MDKSVELIITCHKRSVTFEYKKRSQQIYKNGHNKYIIFDTSYK